MAISRLDKYVSNNTEYTRSQIKDLVKRGRVSIDGVAGKKSDVKVDTERSKVLVCGELVSEFGLRYYMMNKPKGVVCSTDDKDSKTVIDLLPEELQSKNLFPVGRLDKDSEGFVLLTNDGEFSHRILSSKSHVAKYYIVKLARPFETEYVETFKGGIVLSNGEVCLPARVLVWKESPYYAVVELFEGKYHQVKRMFASVGNHVESLYRFQIGNLALNQNIPKGGVLEILHKDLDEILKNTDTIFLESEFQTKISSFIPNIEL
jgi:16S rRNA pseudouridine516 synthase